jgi:hypothetical protein
MEGELKHFIELEERSNTILKNVSSKNSRMIFSHTFKNNISLNYYIVKYSVTMLKYSIVHYI